MFVTCNVVVGRDAVLTLISCGGMCNCAPVDVLPCSSCVAIGAQIVQDVLPLCEVVVSLVGRDVVSGGCGWVEIASSFTLS